MTLQCKDCPYCWRGDGDKYPDCHYYSLGAFDQAPCEIDDQDEPEDRPDPEWL